MKYRPILLVALMGLSALLAGCGLFGGGKAAPEAPPTPVVAYMIGHGRGDATVLDDPQFGQNISITMQDAFTSASGEECKRATLVAHEREAEIVVICRTGQDSWKMAPRIWGQGIE